jgi:hypothetical protein
MLMVVTLSPSIPTISEQFGVKAEVEVSQAYPLTNANMPHQLFA